MLLTVDRFTSNSDATISAISLNGTFQCFGLEDGYRSTKVPGETRIPAGKYRIGIRAVGGFHGKYTSRYPEMHRGMLQVLDVPNFEYILIHTGNTHEHTAGCLLVGMRADCWAFTVQASRDAYRFLYPKLIDAAECGELEILYIDNDR